MTCEENVKIQAGVQGVLHSGSAHCEAVRLFLAGIRRVTPSPSLIINSWFAFSVPILSTLPDGQRTVISSICLAGPNPKCRRGSLADSKLELARTSAA